MKWEIHIRSGRKFFTCFSLSFIDQNYQEMDFMHTSHIGMSNKLAQTIRNIGYFQDADGDIAKRCFGDTL